MLFKVLVYFIVPSMILHNMRTVNESFVGSPKEAPFWSPYLHEIPSCDSTEWKMGLVGLTAHWQWRTLVQTTTYNPIEASWGLPGGFLGSSWGLPGGFLRASCRNFIDRPHFMFYWPLNVVPKFKHVSKKEKSAEARKNKTQSSSHFIFHMMKIIFDRCRTLERS